MWALQGGADAITEEPIDLLAAVAHHDHDCGKTFGFVSSWVNLAEGHLRKLSYEGRAKMFAKMFPEEVKRATELLSETTVKGENDKRRTTSSDCISE